MKTEQEEVKHTPIPWTFERHADWSRYYGNIVGHYSKQQIRTITIQLNNGTEEENKANAEFILEACNNYYSLKSQLQQLQEENERLKAENILLALNHKENDELKSEVKTLREALTKSNEVLTQAITDAGLKGVVYTAKTFGLMHEASALNKKALQSKGE